MKTVKMTIKSAVDFIRLNVNGTQIVTVDLDSNMDGKGKMRKTGNPFVGKGIVKRETLNGMIGYNYNNSINNQAGREGKETRVAKSHPWGTMDSQRLFRIHNNNGNAYLSMKVENVTVHGFFTPDDAEINEAEIRSFIPKKNKSSSQKDLDKEIIARDYAMTNVRAIRMKGMQIDIVQD